MIHSIELMRVRLISFFLICFIFFCSQVQGQDRCGTVPYMQSLFSKKGIPQHTKEFEEWLKNKIGQRKNLSSFRVAAEPYKIPVVVHVIHSGQAIGTGVNISDARILSQIEVLNKDFNRLNDDADETPSEFQPLAGSINIEFVLAKQTPEGAATDGIVRVNGQQSSWSPTSQDELLKAKSYWPSEDYLNIWVTNLSGGNIGYAQFPVSDLPGLEDFQGGLAATDGVVMDYTAFGVGSEDSFYNLGRTTTHEVGHFLGLRHIWGDDNGCSETDYVDDTPNQANETTASCGSLIHPVADACSSMKMYQNYMDYTDDACMNLFTQDQVDRMITILESPDVPRRNSLLNSTGLDDPLPGTIDLEIISIVNPGPTTCDEAPILKLNVSNNSEDVITQLKIKTTVNSSLSETITLTDLMITGQAEISVPSSTLLIGDNDVLVNIIQVNGAPDLFPEDNKIDVKVRLIAPPCEPFSIYGTWGEQAFITFDLPESSAVNMSIINMMGQSIATVYLPAVLNQTYPIENIPTNAIYIVRLQIGKKYYATKVYLAP